MKNNYSDLQEILFWQQLNRQLISLKAQRTDIGDEHHKFLQNFSFDNRLFSKITGVTLLDKVPLSLVTDLSGVCFVNLKLEPWNACLMQLIPNTVTLDVEQALADAFVASGKYDKSFPPEVSGDEGDEDDEELYGFIEKYLGAREEQGRDIANIITRLHQLKTESVQRIMEISDYKSFLSRRESLLFLDLTKHDERREIKTAYLENFCNQADLVVSPVIQLAFIAYLDGLLINKKNEKDLKPSIREFVDHEIAIVEKEYQLMVDFRSKVNDRVYQLNLYEIPICSLSPFFFLENPFPVV